MRPSKIVEFVQENEPSSVTGTPGDTWRKYLQNNGGTGETFYDKEQGYLRQKGVSTWDQYMNQLGYVIGVIWDRLRSWLSSITSSPTNSKYVQEDGISAYILEDGTGNYIL